MCVRYRVTKKLLVFFASKDTRNTHTSLLNENEPLTNLSCFAFGELRLSKLFINTIRIGRD